MRCAWILAVGVLMVSLQSCGSGPPAPPMGLDRHPANSAATLASLRGDGQSAAPPALPPPMVSISPPSPPYPPVVDSRGPKPDRTAVFIVSDFTAPAGINSLPPRTRAELVAATTSVQTVTLLCRGDQKRPSHTYWMTLIRRGLEVKRFLVSQGVPSSRIRVLARSAGAFVADNTTRDGRARNRRIEIHFV